ncbi:hypothetical protein [Hydrogenimonas sp.]
MKRELLALGAGLLLLGGCAQKDIQTNASASGEQILMEQSLGHAVSKSRLKAAVEAAAKKEGWMTTTLGDREIIAEKFFSDTKNIAAEVVFKSNGYVVEYSSGQNISESEAEDLLEELNEAIAEELEKAPAAEH